MNDAENHFAVSARMSFLGLDIGGTSTRAVRCTADGRLLGRGDAPGGNLRSSAGAASDAIAEAARAALRDIDPADRPAAVCLGAAGAGEARRDEVHDAVRRGLLAAGIAADTPYQLVTDLDIAFRAASPAPTGCLLIAGTGAVAARYREWALVTRRDGLGWLLGDSGSGAWIGRRVLRAVAAELDHAGPRTALTAVALTLLGLPATADSQALIRACDGLHPAEWGRFAGPALELAATDAVAARIVADAGDALTATLTAVRAADDGPIVLAGGLLRDGPLRTRVTATYPAACYAAHPVVGACALAAAMCGAELDRTALAAALADDQPRTIR